MNAIGSNLAYRWSRIQRIFRLLKARGSGADIGLRAQLGAQLDFQLGANEGRVGRIRIGDDAWIEQGVSLCAFGGSIDIAQRVFIGPYAVIYGHGGVTIGEETLISMHACILSSEHGVPGRGELMRNKPDIRVPTSIGRDVWLGAGVKVLAGVTIGDGCVVGAGTVVTRDLAPYSISVGVPARTIGARP